jgi:hypothetical protein
MLLEKHMIVVDVTSAMNIRDISFLENTIYVETTFWSWSKTQNYF